MKIIDLVRLLRKHIAILILFPVVLAGLVAWLTKNPDFKYASETTLFTGIASGTSVEIDKSYSYFANNTAFDNLINVIKARETHQQVAIRLLSQHLLLDKPDSKYISAESFKELQRITPSYVKKMVVRKNDSFNATNENAVLQDTTKQNTDAAEEKFSFSEISDQNRENLPPSISPEDYEATVQKLTAYMLSSDTNFVYRLLNFDHPFYSIKSISSITAQRISNSDLVRIKYESNDPGICRQTLYLLTHVCITNYKDIKENRSDAVVKYFEYQLKQASNKLKSAEDKLLEFNKSNNIINYYEQSKAVAIVKEDLEVEFNNKRMKLAGTQAAIKSLEEKLGTRELVQIKSSKIIETRNKLGEINYIISSSEMLGGSAADTIVDLANLKIEAEQLKKDIKNYVSELYSYNNTVNGIPVPTVLNDWISNVIEEQYEKAGLEVLQERIKDFQKQYSIYAPAGANIKRIEREISVSEQEFLEILHGLNLAKLKLQDNELSSNLKTVDPPFYPLSPIPTKRKLIVMASGLFGLIIVLALIFVLEYFDDTLKKQTKASKIIGLPGAGIFPKILLNNGKLNFVSVANRLVEMAIQNIEMLSKNSANTEQTRTLLVFSTLNKEGKTVISGNLARKFKAQGKKVLVLNYSCESSNTPEISTQSENRKNRYSIVNMLLGYPDTRIDYESSFLESSENYLSKDEYHFYSIDENFHSVKNYNEILKHNHIEVSFKPDIVLIELPPVLNYSYPIDLISEADISLLVCRSNRSWTEADMGAVAKINELNNNKTHFILNGVDIQVVESVLGELPKKRSWLRRMVKKVAGFQFFSKSHI